MAGVVLETLSWKKLIILGVSLLLLLLTFFLIGGKIAPNPSGALPVLGTKCLNLGGRLNKEWFIPWGEGNEVCRQVYSLDDPTIAHEQISANQIVFSFWLPPRKGEQLDFSPWQQTMLAVLKPDIEYSNEVVLGDHPVLHLDVRIGYRNKDEDVNAWHEFIRSDEQRKLDCTIDEDKKQAGYQYDCELLTFFELGNLFYDYYLVNIRLPTDYESGINKDIGKLKDINLIAIHGNGGFTKVWLSLKTVMFPMVLLVLIWFWRRIKQLERPANLLERTLFALGITLSILNCPIEWLSIMTYTPWMLLFTDIRQGAFYAMLLCFWIIFTGEHIMDQTERNKLVLYWKHLSAIVFGCFCLFIFDICERGMKLTNPFYTVWATEVGTKMALAIIILAGIAACAYFIFLCYMIFLVFRNIGAKRNALPSMSSARRKFYIGVIYRFKFLMLTTLVCAALTVIFFIISQLSEGQWKWGDENLSLEYTSAFFTGVYGMWNLYVFGLLSLYAPSHKKFTVQTDDTGSHEEEVQLTNVPSETSAVQAFASKVAED